jgi:hypothetical protein
MSDNGRRKLYASEFRHGPVSVPELGLSLGFERIYVGTSVPMILQPVRADDGRRSEITLD